MLPMCNGVMSVNRDYTGETPCGMKFTHPGRSHGRRAILPGFVGHSKYNVVQRKFISGDGGLARIVWLPKSFKEELKDKLMERGKEIGIPDFYGQDRR